jgi:hypothetical protein
VVIDECGLQVRWQGLERLISRIEAVAIAHDPKQLRVSCFLHVALPVTVAGRGPARKATNATGLAPGNRTRLKGTESVSGRIGKQILGDALPENTYINVLAARPGGSIPRATDELRVP